MRIIAGQFRSRVLQAPPGLNTRPTSDRLRETLFNVIAPRIPGSAFLDLYAGSGAVGIEAISRGAAHVSFVERDPAALKVLRGNLERLGITGGFRINAGSVKVFLQKRSAEAGPKPITHHLVFLDPPYDASNEYAATLGLLGGSASAHLAPGALVIAEHRRKQPIEEHYGSLRRTRLLEQGDAALSIYAMDANDRQI
jgi:16S rRNA (guanine(966)-N(2))-methyltransferase RsmD